MIHAQSQYPPIRITGLTVGSAVASSVQCKLLEVVRPPLCAISYAGGIKTIFCASINNIDTANKGAQNHRPEDCELVAAELNAQQHEVFPCLKAAFALLVVSQK